MSRGGVGGGGLCITTSKRKTRIIKMIPEFQRSRFSYNGKNVQHVIVSLTVLSLLQMNAEESYRVEQYYAVEVDAVFTVEEKFHYIVELCTK